MMAPNLGHYGTMMNITDLQGDAIDLVVYLCFDILILHQKRHFGV